MNSRAYLLPLVLFTFGTVDCIGTNDSERPLQPLDYPTLGRTTVDPIVPGVLHLTFDDGPGPYTRHVIDVLNQHGIQATFFVVGRSISGYRDVLEYARHAGHLIANHSYGHEIQPSLSEATFKYRVWATKQNIGESDQGQLFFRFPYGAAGPEQLQWLLDTPFDGKTYRVVGWHADSQDFTFKATADDAIPHSAVVAAEPPCGGQKTPFSHDPLGYAQYAARKTRGGVMLFHDIQDITSEHLDEIINGFLRPESYWSTVPPATSQQYLKFYACMHVDPNLPFSFTALQSGTFPSYTRD
jgi:peptidoglycan/xylan/chitin deacetylase (PgdA/CDA1 family)